MKKRKKNMKLKKGFGLIEMLVVIAVIGILASIVLVNASNVKEKAKIVQAKATAKQIYNAIVILENDTGFWPGHKQPYEIEPGASGNEICDDLPPNDCEFKFSDPEAGLAATDGGYPDWKGPYVLSSQLTDPWGSEYFFDTDYDIEAGAGQKWAVVIGSYGPNGQGLNQYDSDDIIYIIKE